MNMSTAIRAVERLRVLGGDTVPVAMVLGQSLGWRYPSGLTGHQFASLLHLCQLLDMNLGRPLIVQRKP